MAFEIDAKGLTAAEVQQAIENIRKEKHKGKSMLEMLTSMKDLLMGLYEKEISDKCCYPDCYQGGCAFGEAIQLCPMWSLHNSVSKG